ncbi:melanoma-associated antigen 10-like [Manis pentadactyla]|uniref:melanoma-associated antigen 10-like n=1 Tax=Manis pentadactyla TaxID=143292 RepID=UPI00255C8F4A|nr:melanoma-associated antigen 10-like [Manis pentadactyla]
MSSPLEEAYSPPGIPSPLQSPQGACRSLTAAFSVPPSPPDGGSGSPMAEGLSTVRALEDTASYPTAMIRNAAAGLVAFLLHKYCAKEPTTKAEMLERVVQDHQDHFPDIFSHASWCFQVAFGIDVKEVDPSSHCYVLVPTLGLTWDGMTKEQSLPKTGLLALLLGVILLRGGQASEEEVWGVLSAAGVCPGREHFIYGDPRELITGVWVQEQYLEYQQVPDSDPARCELLWGPRAHAEAGEVQVQQFLLRLLSRAAGSSQSPSEEARSNEEHRP